MIPSTFAYAAPDTLHDALSILAANDDDTKVMAGGQSLIPLLKLRLASPAVVMDISRLEHLREIEETPTAFRIGALVTHERLINDNTITLMWSIIKDAGEDLADPLVRNRGTFGGSLAHADPAGDWPAVALATDAVAHVQSLRGTREIPIKDFFTYLFTADIADDEILTHIELPKLVPGTVTAYVKIAHPASGYAVAAAGVSLTIDAGGTCQSRPGRPDRCRHHPAAFRRGRTRTRRTRDRRRRGPIRRRARRRRHRRHGRHLRARRVPQTSHRGRDRSRDPTRPGSPTMTDPKPGEARP